MASSPARLDGIRLISPSHGGPKVSLWGSFHDLMLIIIILWAKTKLDAKFETDRSGRLTVMRQQ